jgi:hypothetical protein
VRYVALADAIEQAAAQEEFPHGTRLPPERALAKLAAVSRVHSVSAERAAVFGWGHPDGLSELPAKRSGTEADLVGDRFD